MQVPAISSHQVEPSSPADPYDSEYDRRTWFVVDFEHTVCQIMQAGVCKSGEPPVPGFTREKIVHALGKYGGDPDSVYEYLNFDP